MKKLNGRTRDPPHTYTQQTKLLMIKPWAQEVSGGTSNTQDPRKSVKSRSILKICQINRELKKLEIVSKGMNIWCNKFPIN